MIRHAVFPAAGLGTRFLPATKVLPKEMLALVDKPILQYGVEECLASGVSNIVLVTARGKGLMEDHFDISLELEASLAARQKHALLATASHVGRMASVVSVRQKEPLGLGHAVLCARGAVGHEPFAVVLPDDVIASQTPCVKQLAEVYDQHQACVVALMEVPAEAVSSYGIVDAEPVPGRPDLYRIRDLVEKPMLADAPSRLAIVGRYVLTPEIFHSLTAIRPGAGGEIQLTDGLKHLLQTQPIYGLKFEGRRYDAGDKLGFLKATVELALEHPELGADFRQYLKDLSLT